MTVVVGAGFSGAVIARRLADAGHDVTVYETRPHVGGNCYTERRHGIVVHVYGPHIFHTGNERVWRWVQQWAEWKPYRLTVRSTARGRVYPLPVNLHTINQVFDTAIAPAQALTILDLKHTTGETFEDAAIGAVGEKLYRLLFAGYTHKQWGIDPTELPASVFRRLPVRFNYNDNYFDHPYQAIPDGGYTPIFERLLDHRRITVRLSTRFNQHDGDHVFWTGPLDAYFGHVFGRLAYRTTHFQHIVSSGDWQGVALMNFADVDEPVTRSTEHKHLAPWERHETTYVSREVPAACGPDDEPFYPLRLAHDRRLLDLYVQRAQQERNVTFLGRLGTYRYLDMDVAIGEALDVADRYLAGDIQPLYVNT